MRHFICFFIACGLLFSPFHASSEEIKISIRIDLSKNMGDLPYLFRGGVFNGNVVPKGYILEKFLEDIKPGAVEFYLAHTTLRPSANMEDLKRRLSEWDEAAKKVVARGGEVFVEIDAMPWWLTSNNSRRPVNPAIGDHTPVGSLSPPKDYNKWADLVEAIVSHFNKKLGIRAKYIIWGEPDTVWWQGTDEEYFKLYRYAVLGAKRADKDAEIGGPAVSVWNGKKKENEKPLIYRFIKYAAQTPLPEAGLKRLPVDFINWHQFNADPLAPKSYSEPAEKIRGWLGENGYRRDTELLVGEWIIWQHFGKEHGFSNVEHDNEVNASYIVSSLIAMDAAGIQKHSYAYLVDSVPGKEFVGDFGLFTKRGIIKASFNAFAMISMLEGKRIRIDNNDLTVRGVASRKEGKISILLSNFVPYGKMILGTQLRQLREKGYTKNDMKRYGLTPEKLRDVAAGKTSVESLNLPGKIKADLKEAQAEVRKYRDREAMQINVQVNFQNGLSGKYRYEKYLIDATHGNSYALRNEAKKVGSKSAQEINALRGVKLEKVEEGTVSGNTLRNLSMSPYSVVLLVLTPE
ncbi:MAG: GH39 family glycosyl hydrolase [Nitrospirota bacterium]